MLTRRELLKSIPAITACSCLPESTLLAAVEDRITRTIPGTEETVPIIGLGSSRTFDVPISKLEKTELLKVMEAFIVHGGGVVDSSPMYGNAEVVIGELIRRVGTTNRYFAATKVWTRGRERGIEQMRTSLRNMNVEVMDLMQIHNLLDWRVHLSTLNAWKAEGLIRYTGITTHRGRNHAELIDILKSQELDFVQFTYNILDRRAEKELFPIVRDKGLGAIINVPFRRGDLFGLVKGKAVPDWAAEFDCKSWGQFFLKFIASHPDVTCVIPATSKVKHMLDNMSAGLGRLPDPDTRQRMIDYMEAL